MKYTKKDLGSYNLHFINTDKFKTITIRIIFYTPIKKEDITKRNLLTSILLQSSKKYNSRRKLTIESEELYAADISANNQRLGNYIFTSFNLQVLNDKYTEEGNIEKAIEFLKEILFNPDVEDGKWKEDKLSLVKHNAETTYDSIKEDSTSYSLMRMAEAYDEESPISYRTIGYREDLENITSEDLWDCYQKMLENDFVDIFVIGDFNNREMLSLIKKNYKFTKLKKRKTSYIVKNKKPRKRRILAKESINNTQSKLSIACPVQNMSEYERNYSLVLANLILGGGTDSKLFQEVREKNSLCYTIHSFYNKLDNLLVITAGIDKNNLTKTVNLITKNLNDMKKGKFSEKDIEVAKEFYYTSAEELEESDNRIINEYLTESILGLEPIEERVKKIGKVKKQEIVKVCKKISMDTIFLLEGTKHEED